MIKHIAHMSPGRHWGDHHESDEPSGYCPVCGKLVIRWSLIESPIGRDWWRAMIRKGLLVSTPAIRPSRMGTWKHE